MLKGGDFKGRGRYLGRIIRRGRLIDEFECRNIIVNQGLDHILGVEFGGVQQITNWYLAPYANNYVPVASDTAQTIVGAAGEVTGYAGGSRQPFAATEGSQQVTNAPAPATFTFTAALTLYGAFLASGQQQQSTQGILFSAAQFASPKTVAAQDQLVLTYLFAASST